MGGGGDDDDDDDDRATTAIEASTSAGQGMTDASVVESIETLAVVGVDAETLARGAVDVDERIDDGTAREDDGCDRAVVVVVCARCASIDE